MKPYLFQVSSAILETNCILEDKNVLSDTSSVCQIDI